MKTPVLRFKDLNGSSFPIWNKTTVNSLFTKIREKNSEGCINKVITNSAEYGLIDQHSFFDKEIASEENIKKYTVIRKGDFVYNPRKSKEAPYGPFNCYDNDNPGIVSPLYTCLHLQNTDYEQFLLWYFKSSSWHYYIAENGAQGGARHDRVGMSDALMKNIPVLLPSLAEQQKIADFLSSYDEKISIQRERVEALERRKKGLLQKVFSQEIRFKADDGKEFPKWDEIPFCKAFSSISNNTLSRSELSFDVKTSVRNIHYGDVLIKYGAVIHTNIDTIPYVIEIEDKLTKEKLLKSGDVIFADTAEDNTVGKACELVLDDDSDSIVAGLHTIAVRPNEAFAFGYLGYFFNSTLFHDQLLPLIQGIKVSSISKRALFSETKVFYPSLPEQRKIADFFTAIDDQINIEKERLATMETIKKGLLQGLFC